MFSRINILDELVKERKISPDQVLEDAKALIESENTQERNILKRMQEVSLPAGFFPMHFTASDAVFTQEQIKNICIKYRLRFLDSRLFKGDIPYEAIAKTRDLEKKHKVKFTEFKILAPASLFKLEDRNKDPLLFARVAEDRYLLIHKWGNDLNAFRRVLVFPLRTIRNFILTLLALSILITVLVPIGYSGRLFVFLLSNLFFLSTFAHIGYLRLNQNFSEFEWDSKYVN